MKIIKDITDWHKPLIVKKHPKLKKVNINWQEIRNNLFECEISQNLLKIH